MLGNSVSGLISLVCAEFRSAGSRIGPEGADSINYNQLIWRKPCVKVRSNPFSLLEMLESEASCEIADWRSAGDSRLGWHVWPMCAVEARAMREMLQQAKLKAKQRSLGAWKAGCVASSDSLAIYTNHAGSTMSLKQFERCYDNCTLIQRRRELPSVYISVQSLCRRRNGLTASWGTDCLEMHRISSYCKLVANCMLLFHMPGLKP